MSLMTRLILVILVVVTLLGGVMLFTYDIIKLEWVSFMEIQPSYRAMDNPLPVAANSIPIEGAAYIPGMGDPVNPIPVDEVSVERARILFSVNCAMCHGPEGQGNGIVGGALINSPANLTGDVTQSKSDGTLFLIVSNGIEGKMPALNENLSVRDRWDLVNYIRTLEAPQPQETP
jgi:mono/diheme cytochrome c family protein